MCFLGNSMYYVEKSMYRVGMFRLLFRRRCVVSVESGMQESGK